VKSQGQRERDKEQWLGKAEEMYDELYEWREKHTGASFDEIGNRVTPRRRALMGELVRQLALQHGSGEVVEGLNCEKCGKALKYKGKPGRGVDHLEGEAQLERAYYHCPECEGGIFPPGSTVEVGETQLESGSDTTSRGSGDTDSIL
jgi:hypothetical protein